MRLTGPKPSTPTPDAALIPRMVAGDGAALELVMRRYNQRLYRVARAIVNNEHEAEDVVQEAYVRAFTNLHRFQGRSSLATWLTRIVLHEALRRRRRARTAARVRADVRPGADGGREELTMEQSERRGRLSEAVDRLPDAMRAIVMLRLVQGLSTRQTAESLRLSEVSVKVGLHRARRILADGLGDLPALHGEFTFGAERCDRVVDAVLARLGATS
ncbi:MAG: RNA polymerase sigma factor [Phycisphaerales bacterium]|nr:RNA polymerase sigma factor [Phycisphaerales bacterium]